MKRTRYVAIPAKVILLTGLLTTEASASAIPFPTDFRLAGLLTGSVEILRCRGCIVMSVSVETGNDHN